jgi:polysaccharide export outer membrane protein
LQGLLVALFAWGAMIVPARSQSERATQSPQKFEGQTTQEYNQRLAQLRRMLEPHAPAASPMEYRIGPEDLLEINVFEASELNRSERVSAGGEVSLPLLGAVHAAGLTPRELESVLEELLRRTYMKDPHVGVFVREMQSHAVAVFGAVKKPGVFQIRGPKTVVELLSMAEGLAEDAGDTVLVTRGARFRDSERPSAEGEAAALSGTLSAEETSPATPTVASATPKGSEALEINLKQLLQSGDPRWNVTVYPGDVVKVARAGIVYVVGEVKKPGGYLLRNNEDISVLQAIALAEGLTRTSAKSQAKIIRTREETGQRTEIAIDLGKILAGKKEDLILRSKDIVFVPNSNARSSLYRGAEAALGIVSGIIVFRR